MLVCIIAYTMQKEAGKNIEPFFFNNLVMKKGRGHATPFWAVRHVRQNLQNYLGRLHTRCKKNHAKIFNRSPVIILQ